jgi:hypothetical protein
VAVRFSVDPWDPAYGTRADELDPATEPAAVELDTEMPAADWSPRRPSQSLPAGEPVWFVDGVRRIDANVWLETPAGPVRGVFASWAAGVVRCAERAEVVTSLVRRGLFAPTPLVDALDTSAGRYHGVQTEGSGAERLWLDLQREMAASEHEASVAAVGAAGAELVVVDGPLRDRAHLRGLVGMVKAHHTRYLPDPAAVVLAGLEPGERTPAFTIGSGTRFARHSWYVRLPGAAPHAYAAVVRCECPASVGGVALVALADHTAAVLPRFASQPHKDRRAPQNLTPIAGLERRLKHLLGDARLLYRALRQEAASSVA